MNEPRGKDDHCRQLHEFGLPVFECLFAPPRNLAIEANLEENIALEDIAQEIMELAVKGSGFEVDPNDARSAFLGDCEPTTMRHNGWAVLKSPTFLTS
jgi:hypothetical protein